MILADMGAEVIRIEDPEGAPDRTWGQLGPDRETLLFKIIGRNKKGITLNQELPEGKEIFRELVKRSDILLHNFTPGAPMAKEINYERLKEVNPSIIVAAVSGYGQTGPDAENPCFDGVAQARAASMVMNGFPGDPICKTGLPYIDVSSGLFAAIGVMLALYYREKRGAGQAVDVSLFDTASFTTQSVGTLLLFQLSGEIRKHIGNRGFHSFNGCFKAQDGSVQISTATNSIWKRFMRAIGREEMISDPRFQNDMDRFYRADLIDSMIKDWFEKRTTEEIVQTLQKARVPCGVVKTVDQLIDDPQVKAREMVKFLDYPQLGEIPVPGIPVKLSLTPGAINKPSPGLGEHNQEIYSGLLGFSPEKILELKGKGVI
jgi:CoA:oxalate CoA-transferase